MEKSSIFEREIVYLITGFLCCHWEIVLFSFRNLAIFEIFIVMEKSSICDCMHCESTSIGRSIAMLVFHQGYLVRAS